ncbi:ATP-binding cassette domain-containing protein [Streptomyces sp. enrichment culture]|uniref:ATP-binding cassette domain-containing protein n=1 Tax=Streptomyces sp. enrichment culture TaxID=1795815 RepID=UPI003F559239
MMNNAPGPPPRHATGQDATAVHAEHLTVTRGPRTVLRDLAFTVPRGRITGLLGPSGCGKSTLMRAVVGTQAKVTGTLDVLGHPAGHPALRTRIGYVTQAPSVYDDLTVRQNLDYFAAILDPGRTAADRRQEHVTRAITDVDLTSHADALAASRGATLLVSSHVMDEAERCDRLLLMREGEVLADDTPDALRTRTGAETVEEAFLHLVDEAKAAARTKETTR